MSEHMKKRHTKLHKNSIFLYIIDNGDVYAIPRIIAKQYRLDAKIAVQRKGNISSEYVFEHDSKKNSKPAELLKGLRARENLTQVAFAKKISVTQANLSKMENGSRSIGKTIAKRIAQAFSVDYRYFLE